MINIRLKIRKRIKCPYCKSKKVRKFDIKGRVSMLSIDIKVDKDGNPSVDKANIITSDYICKNCNNRFVSKNGRELVR